MASFEEECIERYFLIPGNNGPIGSIYIADEDLPELFGVTDLDEARRLFVRSLPAMSILRDYLTGHMTLLPGRISPALKILLFLCWMQTTKTRVKGDREFREMFESHTGYKPANMNGLNGMWDRLRDHLKAVYDVDLDLPDIYPYVQIGRTLRIAFPTWRDKEVLRKLRDDLRHDLLLDPLTVSGKVSTSRHVWDEKMPSLEYNFQIFERARKRGGREFVDTAFWHAWYSVVAEKNTLEELEVVESDFGEYRLFVVSPVGDRKSISDPEQASAAVPKLLAKAIKDGKVFLESLGFGKFRAQTKLASSTVLMRRSKLSEQPSDTIRFSASINHTWVLASFRDSLGQTPVALGSREFGWHDGIRVGGGYLGRAPLTPLIAGPLPSAISVEVSGKPVDLIRVENAMALATGTYSGIALAKGPGGSHEILMVPRAGEIGDARRLAFDLANDIPEDEFHFGTAPSILATFERWNGERSTPSNELITISEALYERTARGLPLSEAVDIVRKGISRTDSAPSEWEIMRSFADAGWFESTFQRRYPARRLLQRKLSHSLVGDDAITIHGPTPLAVLDRLRVAAIAAGGTLEEWFGPSEWVLPRYLVRAPDLRSQQEFLHRAALPLAPSFVQAEPDKADTSDVHGYEIVGKLREDRGYFATSFASEMVGGLYRLDRPGSNSHFLYRSVVDGKQDQNYLSPSVALLSHRLRTGGALFKLERNALSAIRARTYLPSSWARWLSNSCLCNAGPMREKGGWRYQYPVVGPTVSAIAKLLPIQTSESTTTLWIDRFLLSASNRERAIHDSRAGRVRSAAPRINEKS